MLFNKKDFNEYQHMRVGEYLFFNQTVFNMEQLNPNNKVYNNFCSLKGFSLVNSLTALFIVKKYKSRGSLQVLSRLLIASYVNYTLFYRSFKQEYDRHKITLNKFERILNSFVDPLYIYKKDKLILIFISIACLPFNKVEFEDKLLVNKEEIPETKLVAEQVNTVPVSSVLMKKEEKLKQGRFL